MFRQQAPIAGDYSTMSSLERTQEYTADAWKDARLNGTWTQTISEAALIAATSGGSLVCGTSRLAAIATATARTTALAVEVYDGYQNVVAAHQNFQEGNVWTGLYHAGLAVLNVIGGKGGIRQLKNDVHIAAFPGDHCYPAGTPLSTESGLRPIESVWQNERVWSFNLATSEWELCRVAETYSREHEGALVGVFVGGTAIESTYHHPYWVLEGENLSDRPEPDHVRAATVRDAIVPGRWVDAGDLRIGDVLLLQVKEVEHAIGEREVRAEEIFESIARVASEMIVTLLQYSDLESGSST